MNFWNSLIHPSKQICSTCLSWLYCMWPSREFGIHLQCVSKHAYRANAFCSFLYLPSRQISHRRNLRNWWYFRFNRYETTRSLSTVVRLSNHLLIFVWHLCLDLKRTLLLGRGRGNSFDEDMRVVTFTELLTSISLRIVIPLLVFFIARVCNVDVGVYLYINGGVLGVILSWILPILSYKSICHLRFISSYDTHFMFVALLLGIIVLVTTILVLVFTPSLILSKL